MGLFVSGSRTGEPEAGSVRTQSCGLFTRSSPSGSGIGGSNKKCSSGLPNGLRPHSAYTPPGLRSPQPRGAGMARSSNMRLFCYLKRVQTYSNHFSCGENVRTPHGIARVWPWPGKEPHQDIARAIVVTIHDESTIPTAIGPFPEGHGTRVPALATRF